MLIVIDSSMLDHANPAEIENVVSLVNRGHTVLAYHSSTSAPFYYIKGNLNLLTLRSGESLRDQLPRHLRAVDSEKTRAPVVIVMNSSVCPYSDEGRTVYHCYALGDLATVPGLDSVNAARDRQPTPSAPPPATPQPNLHATAATSPTETSAIQTEYETLRSALNVEAKAESVTQFLTTDKEGDIIQLIPALITYEQSLPELPNPSLLDLLYRHDELTLVLYFLSQINKSQFEANQYCTFSTKDFLCALAPEQRLQWAEHVLTMGHGWYANQPLADKAQWWVTSLGDTGLDSVLNTDGGLIRWYIMETLLEAASTLSSPISQQDFLRRQLTVALTNVLVGEWQTYLQSKANETTEDSLWTRLSRPAKPVQPRTYLDKSVDTKQLEKIVAVLSSITPVQLTSRCSPDTHKRLLTLWAGQKQELATVLITQTISNMEAVFGVKTPQCHQAIIDEFTLQMKSKAIGFIIDPSHPAIAAEIVRQQRLLAIATRRHAMSQKTTCAEQTPPYTGFLVIRVAQINTIIEKKLQLFENGPWANKSPAQIEKEFEALETMRDMLRTLRFVPIPTNTTDEAISREFSKHLEVVLTPIRANYSEGFDKHGRGRFFSLGLACSKTEAFYTALIEDAKSVMQEFRAGQALFKVAEGRGQR